MNPPTVDLDRVLLLGHQPDHAYLGGDGEGGLNMAALRLISCILLIFGLAEVGYLLRFRIEPASEWLGAIIPIGIVMAIGRIPKELRLSWALVACGFVVGVGGRRFGLLTLSLIGWFGFGVAALTSTLRVSAPSLPDRRYRTRVWVWSLVAVLVIAAILFFPPM